jgi:hypothetical protein
MTTYPYTVIWRDSGDDYMYTTVDTALDPANMTNGDWVFLAGAVEYAEWDETDRLLALAALLEGYDLLDVFIGTPQSALVE